MDFEPWTTRLGFVNATWDFGLETRDFGLSF
jgi:hypothetical protein